MDKFNGQSITPSIAPIPVQLTAPQAAVMTATLRIRSALSVEASQLEGTYGLPGEASFFLRLVKQLDTFANEYVEANKRLVVVPSVIPDLGGA